MYVFGSSSGAIVALNLLVQQPGQTRIAVAHESPLVALLPDAETGAGSGAREKLQLWAILTRRSSQEYPCL